MSSDPTDQNVQHSNSGPEGLDAEAVRFLASLQQRLTQVQSTSNDLKNRECALAELDKSLNERKAELEQAERVLASTQSQLAARTANIDDRERAAAASASQLQEQRARIERAEQESATERERLIAEARDAAQRIDAEARTRAQEQMVAVDRSRAEAAKAAEHAESRSRQADEREAELDAREEAVARDTAACAAKLHQAEEAAAAVSAREGKLKQAERAIAEREKAAAAIAELAAKRAAEHTAAVAAVEQRRAEIDRAERTLRTAQEELQTRTQSAAQLKAELDRREGSILGREQQLRAAQEELERRRVFVSQCEAQATQLEATSRHLREQAEQIKASAERQVAQWQDKATEAQFQSDSAQQQVQKLQEQLTAAQARARALEEEMDQVKVLGINVSPEAQGRIDGLTKRAEIAEQRAATLQEIIDQHSDEVAKAEARYDTLARQLDEAQHAIGTSGDAHTQQIAAWKGQAEQHAAQLAAAHAAAQQARADADRAASELNDQKARAAQADERAQAMATRVADAEQNASHAVDNLKQACEQAAQAARAEAAIEAKAQIEAVKSASPENDLATQRRIVDLEKQLKKRDAEVSELRAKVAVAQSEATAGEGEGFNADQRRRLEAELAQREEALSVLANRLLNSEERTLAMQAQMDRLSDELSDWEEKAASGTIGRIDAGGGAVVHNATPEVAPSDSRRRRLRRVRELLAQEHRKVLLAKEALGRHKAEADGVLQQRARLSQLAQNLQAAEAEADKTRAKSAAGSVIVAAMMTLITVCGLSYLAAGVLWPSTYAARATLAAESDGRSPTDQQNSVWTSAHERLATDLQVYTLAAERFQQRGMRDLATAAAVQDRFGSSLAVLTDVPGQITFELRGVGRENTARELETFAGAVSAIANSRRQMRPDGMGTNVVKQAEAGSDALDGKRQTAMLAALVVGLAASAGAGFAAYKVLSRTRKPQAGADPLDTFAGAPIARLAPERTSNNAAA
jgi:hypothetical protein